MSCRSHCLRGRLVVALFLLRVNLKNFQRERFSPNGSKARLEQRYENISRKGAKAQSSDLRLPEVFLCAFAPLREKFFVTELPATDRS